MLELLGLQDAVPCVSNSCSVEMFAASFEDSPQVCSQSKEGGRLQLVSLLALHAILLNLAAPAYSTITPQTLAPHEALGMDIFRTELPQALLSCLRPRAAADREQTPTGRPQANSTEILGWLLCVAVLGPFLAGIGAICSFPSKLQSAPFTGALRLSAWRSEPVWEKVRRMN